MTTQRFLVWSSLKDNRTMSGIQFVTDEKGRKVGVLIDLKKHGAIWEDFWDGLVSESAVRKRVYLRNNTGPVV